MARKYLLNLPPAEDTTQAASPLLITPGFLRFVGETVFGGKWQTRLAEALGETRAKKLSPATVHQWTTGQRSIPPWVAQTIAAMIEREEARLIERATRSRELAQRLHRLSAPTAKAPRPSKAQLAVRDRAEA